MTQSNLWLGLVRLGLAADMPIAPEFPAGVAGLYYATDEVVWYSWTGSAWAAFAAGAAQTATTASQVSAVEFADLPATPVTGMVCVVTDAASAYAKGATVAAGGGTDVVLAFYNGTNWVSA